jgi:hypothetical protein
VRPGSFYPRRHAPSLAEIQPVFKGKLAEPAGKARPGLARDAAGGHPEIHERGAHGDLQQRRRERERHAVEAAVPALDGVQHAGQKIEPRLHGQIRDAHPHDRLAFVRGEQPHERLLEQKHGGEDNGIVAEPQRQPAAEALAHARRIARAAVLRRAGHDAVADALRRDAGEVVEPADRVERRDRRDALRVDDALDEQLADRLAGLLQGGQRAAFERLGEQRPVDRELAPPEPQAGLRAPDAEEAQRGGQALGEHRGQRRAGHAQMKAADQQHVKERVERGRDAEIHDRRARVADAAQGARHDVVLEGEEKPEEDDAQVDGGHAERLVRHAQQREQRPREQKAGDREPEREQRAEENRGRELALEPRPVARAEEAAHEHRGPEAEPRYAEDQDRHDGVRGADGRERVFARELADHDGVDRVVGQLQQVPQDGRDGVGQEVARDAALGHISHACASRRQPALADILII